MGNFDQRRRVTKLKPFRPIIHYRHEIDVAAYVLTDWPVMQALTRAADRGIKVRIYPDGT